MTRIPSRPFRTSQLWAPLLAALVVASIGCGSAPEEFEVYGEPTLAATAVAVDVVIAEQEHHVNSDVTVEGTVHAVCQMDGCWLTLQSLDGESIRVDVARTDGGDYAFTVPTDISGRRVVAHGLLSIDDSDAATMREYSQDAGETMQPAALSMVARGVMVAPE